MSSCGQDSSEIKLYVTTSLDQITNFPGYGVSPVRFICGTSKVKKLRMVGHVAGELRFIAIDSLKEELTCRVDLMEREELTAGAFT
jgi:hypothetical protein